jgi:cobalt-zinc-cadmium efflux system membrane fusion protein
MFKIANTSQLLAVVNIPADKLNVVKTSNKVTIQSDNSFRRSIGGASNISVM